MLHRVKAVDTAEHTEMRTSIGRRPKVRVTISDTCFSLGWWMVMSDDEQGYAPASYLEPVEESGSGDVHPEDQTNQGGWG